MADASPRTLVTERMRGMQGVWSEPIVSDPISASTIRRWGIALYWPETPPRLYWDEEYARSTRWGGLVAPQDFNPFAWILDRPERTDPWENNFIVPPLRPETTNAIPAGPGERGMNGGQTDTFGVPMRPGDVITERHALIDWMEREGSLGLTLFTNTEHRWTNQRDELVKRRIAVSIRY